MKRIFALITAIVGLSACDKTLDKPDPINPITPDKDWITFSPSANLSPVISADGGSVAVSFSAYGNWQLADNQQRVAEWLTVSPSSGSKGDNTITITADVNGTYDERNATVKLTCGTETKSIVVTQKQKDAITVSKSKFEISAMGETISVEVKANIEYSYKIEDDAKSWVAEIGTKAMAAKTLSFKISENEDNDKREGTITFSSGDIKETIKIYQEGAKPAIVLTQSEYAVAAGGETIKVEVKSNVDVSYSIASGIDWIIESNTKAMSTSTFYFQIAANESYESRTAEIFFRNEANGLSEKVIITQVPKNALVIAKNSYNIDNKGGNIEIEVSHNVDFDIDIADSWVSQISTKSYTTDKLVFTVAENTTTDNRETKITFTSKDKTISQDVIIYQSQSNALILSEKEKAISADGGTFTIEINHNVDFDVVMSDVDWITEVETKAMLTSTKSFSVAKNDSYDARTAEIIFKSKDSNLSDKVTVTQMQKGAIIVAKDLYEFDRSGGELTVEVNHSVDFEIEISDGWITEVTTKALSTTTETFSIAKNDSGKEREGIITFNSKNEAISQRIVIKQSIVATIVTSEKSITFENTGGSAIIEINPDINFDFDVICPDNNNYDQLGWISTSSIKEPRIHLTVNPNTSYDRRRALLIVKDIDSERRDTVQIYVKQQEYLESENDNYEISYEGGIINIPFSASYDYKVYIPEDATWISLIQTKSIQEHNLSFSIEENKTDSYRETNIEIFLVDGHASKKINIKQYTDVYIGNITISSNSSDIISFLRKMKFRKIDGSIYSGGSMSDLDNYISEITGSLVVQRIHNFDGLYGLKKIGKDLKLYSTTTLPDLEGLNNLEEIGGNLYCNDYCTVIDVPYGPVNNEGRHGFVGEYLKPLRKLRSIGGSLDINLKSTPLPSLEGLENLEIIGQGIYINNISSFTGICPRITQLSTISISNAQSLVGLENLTQINGNVTICNGKFNSFSGLKGLVSIGGTLLIKAFVDVNGTSTVEEFNNITSMEGFESLSEIGGDLEIYSYVDAGYGNGYGLNNLSCLSGFKCLNRIGGDLKIKAYGCGDGYSHGASLRSRAFCLNNLQSIDIPSLKEIGGNIIVDNVDSNDGDGESYSLINVSDFSFSSLETIGGDITYHYMTHKGAGDYYEEEGYGKIKKAPNRLKCVKNINAICSFESESDGFVSLESVENLYGNGVGFPNLKNISSSFTITGANIKDLGIMPLLETIGDKLTVSSTSISEISGLNKLSKVGTIIFENNNALSNITGFKELRECSSISFSNSPLLYDFSSFVEAVKNGSSWSVIGCGYNPTKYQMQNGQSKQ